MESTSTSNLPQNNANTMTGDVNLGPPKEVHLKDMKTWLNDNHDVATPIDPANLAKLKEEMSK